AVFSARLTLSPGGDGSPAFRLDHGCGELPGAAGVGQPEGERPVHVAELGDRPVVAPLGAADLVHAAVLAAGPVAVEQLEVGGLAALPQRVVAVDHQDPQRAGGVGGAGGERPGRGGLGVAVGVAADRDGVVGVVAAEVGVAGGAGALDAPAVHGVGGPLVRAARPGHRDVVPLVVDRRGPGGGVQAGGVGRALLGGRGAAVLQGSSPGAAVAARAVLGALLPGPLGALGSVPVSALAGAGGLPAPLTGAPGAVLSLGSALLRGRFRVLLPAPGAVVAVAGGLLPVLLPVPAVPASAVLVAFVVFAVPLGAVDQGLRRGLADRPGAVRAAPAAGLAAPAVPVAVLADRAGRLRQHVRHETARVLAA